MQEVKKRKERRMAPRFLPAAGRWTPESFAETGHEGRGAGFMAVAVVKGRPAHVWAA